MSAKDKRLELHEKLCELLGSRDVYFQPPESKELHYPCIIYNRSTGDTQFANNMPYAYASRYTVQLIDPSPDSDIFEKIVFAFPTCRFDRWFTQEHLNHYNFDIYY